MEKTIYKKTYAIYGMIEKSIVLPINKARIRVDFTRGTIGSNGVTPAKFTTSDTVVQTAIENSQMFKNGVIKEHNKTPIRTVTIQQSHKEETPSEDTDKTGEQLFVYTEVKNVQEAKYILMDDFGVSLAELQNKAQTIEKANQLGVKFPNLK